MGVVNKMMKLLWRIYYFFAPVSVIKTKIDVMKFYARTKGIDDKIPKVFIKDLKGLPYVKK